MDAEHYPHRLLKEARRTAERLEFILVSETVAAGMATVQWARGDRTSVLLIVGAVGAVAGVPITWTLRRRQLHRMAWLASTPRWWERMDEMPRMEPFPWLVDWVEGQGDRVRRLGHGWRART